MHEKLAQDIIAARDNRRPVALLTWLTSGEQRLVKAEETVTAVPELAATLTDAFRLDRSSTVDTPKGEVFIRVYNPRVRLVIIGAVHTSQFLLPLARLFDYDVTIIDPREAFASPERFPDARLFADWPQDVLPGIGLDTRTALVALTHDAKIDDNALALALASSVFYIGALGSSRTHAKRLERLKARPGAAFTDETLARIHGPVGLSIGAQGPAEIALSIMAQITAALRGKL